MELPEQLKVPPPNLLNAKQHLMYARTRVLDGPWWDQPYICNLLSLMPHNTPLTARGLRKHIQTCLEGYETLGLWLIGKGLIPDHLRKSDHSAYVETVNAVRVQWLDWMIDNLET